MTQPKELLAPAGEERIRADNKPAGMKFGEGREGGIDLAFGAGLQDRELELLRAHSFLDVSYCKLDIRTVRVHQQGDHLGLGNQLGQQLEPLGRQLGVHIADAREVPAWPR